LEVVAFEEIHQLVFETGKDAGLILQVVTTTIMLDIGFLKKKVYQCFNHPWLRFSTVPLAISLRSFCLFTVGLDVDVSVIQVQRINTEIILRHKDFVLLDLLWVFRPELSQDAFVYSFE